MAQKKIASNFKNIVLCLLLIAAISASVLGIVYKSTKKSIEQSKEAKKENAIKQVLPDYTRLETEKIIAPISNDNKKTLNDDILKKELKADSITIHKAYKNEKLVGFAVETFTNKGWFFT